MRKTHLQVTTLFIVTILFSLTTFSQENIFEINNFKEPEVKHNKFSVEDLTVGIVPTVTFENGKSFFIDKEPIRIISDVSSFQMIRTYTNKESIKVIVVNIHNEEEYKKNISKEMFKEFPNVEYIYINSSVLFCSKNEAPDCEIKIIKEKYYLQDLRATFLFSANLPR